MLRIGATLERGAALQGTVDSSCKDLTLTMRPSDYWHRQCYATYQSDPIGIRLLDILGEDNVMWGSDFPHPDGVWPDSQAFIARELAGVPEAARRKIVCENAAKLYGFGA